MAPSAGQMERSTTSLKQQLTAPDKQGPEPPRKLIAGMTPEEFKAEAEALAYSMPDSNARGSQCYLDRGSALAALRRFDEAVADFTQAIELAPNSAKAYRMRAEVYELLGKSDLARADEQQASLLYLR